MYVASDIGAIKMGNERIFDTLHYANKLKAVGVPEKQAEVHAETMVEIISNNLATKQDLEPIKSELKRDILATNQNLDLVKNELKQNLKELELRMTIKLGGLMVCGLSILVILMKLFKL